MSTTATEKLSQPAKPENVFIPTAGGRKVKNSVATVLFTLSFFVALVPLIALLYKVIVDGFPVILDLAWWTEDMRGIGNNELAGGVLHAIYGSVVQVLMASIIAIPLGVLAGILLVEFSESKLAKPTTFMVDVLAGVPSIVAAIFIFGVWMTTFGMRKSGFAVALALVLLMLPLVIRSTEEMLKLVPDELREASLALGVPRWKTIVFIVIPTALSGMISGIFLAVARVMGETAPVLVLVGYSSRANYDAFEGNMASLPLLIYNERSNATDTGVARQWGAALTLIILIAIANILATAAAKALQPKTSSK